MCTVTLSYDQNNALARRKLAALLATRTRHRDLLNLQNQTKMIPFLILSVSTFMPVVSKVDFALTMRFSRHSNCGL